MRKPLEDITVLDLTRVLAGPYCGMILADYGANVIKVEEPKKGDLSRENTPKVNGESGYYMALNRNKRGITLNLKSEDGKKIFLELVKRSDVVLENYRPGVMDKLGLGYEKLKEVNPGIIYAAVSGFGQTGPYRDRAGYDIVGQAMSGIMDCTGWPDTPPTRCGAPIGDTEAGMNCAIGILIALHNRDYTGFGQMIDVSLVDAMVSSLITINMRYLNGNLLPHRTGNRYENSYPYDAFKTKDGYIAFAATYDRQFRRLCECIGHPEYADDPRMCTLEKRIENHDMIKEAIEEWTVTMKTKDLVDLMHADKLAVSEVKSIKEVTEDPHIAGVRNMFLEMDHPVAGKVRITNNAIHLSEYPSEVRIPSPTLGQHTEEVLKEMLGYQAKDFAKLREEGAI